MLSYWLVLVLFFFLTFIFSKLRASLDLLLLDNSFCRRLSGSAALPHSLVLLSIYVFFSFSLCSAGFFLCFCTNISPCLKTLWEFPQMWHKCPIRHSEHTVWILNLGLVTSLVSVWSLYSCLWLCGWFFPFYFRWLFSCGLCHLALLWFFPPLPWLVSPAPHQADLPGVQHSVCLLLFPELLFPSAPPVFGLLFFNLLGLVCLLWANRLVLVTFATLLHRTCSSLSLDLGPIPYLVFMELGLTCTDEIFAVSDQRSR